MSHVFQLKDSVINGSLISKEQALQLVTEELADLLQASDQIRKHFCGDSFDLCSIINGKSGRCSEDCKFCGQSITYPTKVEAYPLLSKEKITAEGLYNYDKGVLRYSVVTSGRNLSEAEIDGLCEIYRHLYQQSDLSLCASHGLLRYEQFLKLKEAGVSRYHNNLETSERFFPYICTTHTYADKIDTIKAAQRAGLTVCSGGIFGLGETMEDRIDMAIALRELGIRSIPINILNPIANTPLQDNPPLSYEDVLRSIAVFRFIHPDSAIRMAGGRGLLSDKGKRAFAGGANAAITGDMLTTSGISIEEDMDIIDDLGYVVRYLSDKE